MPPIDDRAQWNNNYLSGSADWVNFETTVSTSSGQIALAPGYLQRKWTKDGRNYFEYKSEAKLLPRSEERREGKECVSTGRLRWAQYRSRKKTNKEVHIRS